MKIENQEKSRRNRYIKIMKKMEDSEYSYDSNNSRPRRMNGKRFTFLMQISSDSRKSHELSKSRGVSEKSLNNNVIRLNRKEKNSMSAIKTRGGSKAEIPKVISSSTFKADDLRHNNFILSKSSIKSNSIRQITTKSTRPRRRLRSAYAQ